MSTLRQKPNHFSTWARKKIRDRVWNKYKNKYKSWFPEN